MLEHVDHDDPAAADFAARHRSESYFCRYRGCPRSVQGFSSSDLRQEHESCHTPRFRCNDAACEVLGTGLTSRAALNKHNKKYHDDNGLAAIPISLRKASAHPQLDRSRFLLKESSSKRRKRSFHVIEEDKVGGEVHVALNTKSSIQDLRLPGLNCICGLADFDHTVYCGLCGTVQHVRCYYLNVHGDLTRFKKHFCIDCKPRVIDVTLATSRQRKRIRENSEYLRAVERAKELFPTVIPMSSFWSEPEIQILPIFIRQYGENWRKIAAHMRRKTCDEVYKSSFNNGHTADRCNPRLRISMSKPLPTGT